MINPNNITDFNATTEKLEELLLFWICAAGKNGITAARCLERLLIDIEGGLGLQTRQPFHCISKTEDLPDKLKNAGIGCYTTKARSMKEAARSGLDLKTCSVDDLENIYGIGPKSARCFILHTRSNARVAGLDRHILSFLRDRGYEVPVSTPTGNKYKKIERWFLNEADRLDKDPAQFDLELWNSYREK